MEKFEISVKSRAAIHHFEVKDYMQHDGETCKYEVFENGRFIASFEPDAHKQIHVCKDAGVLKAQMLDIIADQLERYHI